MTVPESKPVISVTGGGNDMHLYINTHVRLKKKRNYAEKLMFWGIAVYGISMLFLLLSIFQLQSKHCILQHNLEQFHSQLSHVFSTNSRLSREVFKWRSLQLNGIHRDFVKQETTTPRCFIYENERLNCVSGPLTDTTHNREVNGCLCKNEENLSIDAQKPVIQIAVSKYRSNNELHSLTDYVNISGDTQALRNSSPGCVHILPTTSLSNNTKAFSTSSKLLETLGIKVSSSWKGDEKLPENTQTVKTGESELVRSKRSGRRGNQDGRKLSNGQRRKQSRKPRYSGPTLVHFSGALPEIEIHDKGLVGPWFPDRSASSNYSMSKFFLREEDGSVEVTEGGLYLIYAQIYYLTSQIHNSFTVSVLGEGKTDRITVAMCSATAPYQGTVGAAEVSCFTSVVRCLNANDRIYVRQREKNRTLILRDGHSFLGLVKLGSDSAVRN